jgi:hypothetical protein
MVLSQEIWGRGLGGMNREADQEELRSSVEDVFNEICKFRWGDLASRLPVERSYVRPHAKGEYLSVAWRCEWATEDRTSIICMVAGYLSEDHQTPLFQMNCEIRRSTFMQDIWADLRGLLRKRDRAE